MKVDVDKYDAVSVGGYKSNDSPFKDNMYGHCGECGSEIQWRPHTPHSANILMLCPRCGLQSIKEAEADGIAVEHVVTDKTKAEFYQALDGKPWLRELFEKDFGGSFDKLLEWGKDELG